jgi:hypothetical protein
MLSELALIVSASIGAAIVLPRIALAVGLIVLAIRNPSIFAATTPRLIDPLRWRDAFCQPIDRERGSTIESDDGR